MIFRKLLNKRESGWIQIEDYILDKDDLLRAYKVFVIDWLTDSNDAYKQYLYLKL